MLAKLGKSATSRRAAFSLAELVISVGILILMMALAGQVFTITIRSTGQATALTEVSQELRIFEETLREDLRNVQPGYSIMLIEGNPVNAYWTQFGKEADDNPDPSDGYGSLRDLERETLNDAGQPQLMAPRADILMFFTARKGASHVHPSISSNVQQVVYGHADIGEYQVNSSSGPSLYTMNLGPGLSSTPAETPPAETWHLARRSVLVLPNPGPFLSLNATAFLTGEDDVLWNVDYLRDVLRPTYNANGQPLGPLWFLPPILSSGPLVATARSQIDPSPPMMMSGRMGAYFLPHCASFRVEWCLNPRSPFVAGRLDGLSEVFWFDHADAGDTSRPTFKGPDPLYALQKKIDELKGKSDVGSKALRTQLESLLCEQVQHSDGRIYSLADRFRGATCNVTSAPGKPKSDPEYKWDQLGTKGQPSLVAFTALRPHADPSLGEAPDDIWPGALRITVDVYDPGRRLERPIRHVMVIPVGG